MAGTTAFASAGRMVEQLDAILAVCLAGLMAASKAFPWDNLAADLMVVQKVARMGPLLAAKTAVQTVGQKVDQLAGPSAAMMVVLTASSSVGQKDLLDAQLVGQWDGWRVVQLVC